MGAYPRQADHAVVLPRLVRVLGAEYEERTNAPAPLEPLPVAPDDALTIHPRPLAPPAPDAVLRRDEVENELARFLADDTARAATLAAQASLRRTTVRASLRENVGTRTPAHLLHGRPRKLLVRKRHSRLSGALRSAPIRRRPAPRFPPPAEPVAAPPLVPRAPARTRENLADVGGIVAAGRENVQRRWRLREAVRIAVLSLFLSALVGSAVSLTRLPRLGQKAAETSQRGAQAVLRGVTALVAADARAGAREFAAASRAFQDAGAELADATSLFQRLAARLDPERRLTTAERLLAIGRNAAALGQQAAATVEDFERPGRTLTDALIAASPRLVALQAGLTAVRGEFNTVPLGAFSEDDARRVRALKDAVGTLDGMLLRFLRSQDILLELLGARFDRQYLFLFQNHRELRPTGGFIGSFALVDISRGRVRDVQVDTIYNPDGQLKDVLAPPRPLRKITDRWYARDANWFADFHRSAWKVANLFERSGGPTVDGVIAVTPLVLEDLLRLTGPIPMPDYGIVVTADNVLQETQRLVTYDYDRAQNEPKAFIADLLPEVFARVAALPRARWGELADIFLQSLRTKRLLLSLRDEEAERLVRELGWGGTLPVIPAPATGVLTDHLGRVEANIGGHKTDDLLEQRTDYDVTLETSGAVTGTLVVTRHHRGGEPGRDETTPDEDPSVKPNIVYERTFVPEGSTLLEARGFEPEGQVPAPFAPTIFYDRMTKDADLAALEAGEQEHESGIRIGTESGMTTFGGWVITGPRQTTVTVLRYRLPARFPRPSFSAQMLRYELLLTHQPGHLPVQTTVTLRAPAGFRFVWAGPSGSLAEVGEERVRYTAVVDRDLTWGAVVEER